jgi:hypothetical protein
MTGWAAQAVVQAAIASSTRAVLIQQQCRLVVLPIPGSDPSPMSHSLRQLLGLDLQKPLREEGESLEKSVGCGSQEAFAELRAPPE